VSANLLQPISNSPISTLLPTSQLALLVPLHLDQFSMSCWSFGAEKPSSCHSPAAREHPWRTFQGPRTHSLCSLWSSSLSVSKLVDHSHCKALLVGSLCKKMAFQSAQTASAAPGLPSGLRQLFFINETNFETVWITGNMVKCPLWCRIHQSIEISCGFLSFPCSCLHLDCTP
jgi:hypothetical protein